MFLIELFWYDLFNVLMNELLFFEAKDMKWIFIEIGDITQFIWLETSL